MGWKQKLIDFLDTVDDDEDEVEETTEEDTEQTVDTANSQTDETPDEESDEETVDVDALNARIAALEVIAKHTIGNRDIDGEIARVKDGVYTPVRKQSTRKKSKPLPKMTAHEAADQLIAGKLTHEQVATMFSE